MSDANQIIMNQAKAEELQTELNRITLLLNKVLDISEKYVPEQELKPIINNLRQSNNTSNS